MIFVHSKIFTIIPINCKIIIVFIMSFDYIEITPGNAKITFKITGGGGIDLKVKFWRFLIRITEER
jgi:hypothetical protein